MRSFFSIFGLVFAFLVLLVPLLLAETCKGSYVPPDDWKRAKELIYRTYYSLGRSLRPLFVC